MQSLSRVIRDNVWRPRGLGGKLGRLALRPASGLYGTAVALRNLAYGIGILPTHRAAVPVVSVGNIAAGGTGKTPITLWLARRLAERGPSVGIVLRGYGGGARGVTVVSRGNGPEADVATAGDEAVMLAKCFDGVVVTAPRRLDGVEAAARAGCDLVILDDGFQHRALARDFDLVLVNNRPGGLLPAGPLREPRRSLRRADALALVCKDDDADGPPPADLPKNLPGFVVRFEATALVESDAGRWSELPLSLLSGTRVGVVSGIADPLPFYAILRQWEAHVEEVFEYPDHYRYTAADWQEMARARNFEVLVTTEKDLVKLEQFPFARGRLLAVRIRPVIAGEEALLDLILERTRPRRAA